MTIFFKPPQKNVLEKISGHISRYKRTRENASFFFTESDQTAMGVMAVASAAVGLPGVAASLSFNSSSMEEEADFVEFELNGKKVRGWLWRSPFNEGDKVDVAVEKRGDYYELFGIINKDARIISLYPHCSRGSLSHLKNTLKWALIFETIFFFILSLFTINSKTGEIWLWTQLISNPSIRWMLAAVFFAITLIALSMILKWIPFVRLAEKVFETLELPNPKYVDLVKSSKNLAMKGDAPECGIMYFKY